LKTVLMLYQLFLHLNFSETPFKYGIYTEPRAFSSLLKWLLPLELITQSTKPWG
jgi:hypothetical protein